MGNCHQCGLPVIGALGGKRTRLSYPIGAGHAVVETAQPQRNAAIVVLPMLRRGVFEERQVTSEQDNINAAIAVQQSGIRPGDKIAYIGDGIRAFWAKLDKVYIVAEAPSHYWSANGDYRPVASSFWQSPESEQAAICDALRKTDAAAILALKPSTRVPEGWQQVGGSRLCVKFLR